MTGLSLFNKILEYDFDAKRIYSIITYKQDETVLNVFFDISDEKYKELIEADSHYKNDSSIFLIEKISENRAHIHCTYRKF